MYGEIPSFDQLSLERTVKALSNLRIRQSPLTWEKAKQWAKQFDDGPEKALAWLILRYFVFRTTDQLSSSIRQALKSAAQQFGRQNDLPTETNWRSIIDGTLGGLSFHCAPPTFREFSVPGKSGELIARLVNRDFGISKTYAFDISVLEANERLLIVDDGTFTGEQLKAFLAASPQITQAVGKVAVVVAIAHESAISMLNGKFPDIPVYCGETLTVDHCFNNVASTWVSKKIWPFSEISPGEVYDAVCRRHSLFEGVDGTLGFGNLGVMVGYEHGIPDDSLRLLWDKSATWTPLIER